MKELHKTLLCSEIGKILLSNVQKLNLTDQEAACLQTQERLLEWEKEKAGNICVRNNS